MTVSQLREQMMDKVVPEKVMPQNITSFLVDEDAEIPELDAFTFLNRLRSLGIGSADFIYLLKGCNAPAQAVERIESNPAMNLNSLILTLDGAGLTSQDYTRMLYTARQLWERTLTMRIQNVDEPEPDVKEYIPHAKIAESYPEEVSEYERETVPEIVPEDIPEVAEEEPPSESILAEEIPETEQESAEPVTEETPEDSYSVDSIIAELMGEKPAEETTAQPVSEPEQAETAAEEPTEETLPESAPEENDAGLNITARVFTETAQFDKLRDGLDEEEGESAEEQAFPEQAEPRESGYDRGALITAAVGAVALFAVNAVVGALGFKHSEEPELRYAADSAEIFSAIYSSYNKGVVGGENIVRYSPQEAELFGSELLVQQSGGFGTFCVDGVVYVCDSGAITLAQSGSELLPPEGEFVSVFEQEGALFAVYGGEDSGFMRIEDGNCVYVSEQAGELCDLVVSDGRISLGTAYVPAFTESFSVEQTDHYMPAVGGNVISAENVLLSGEDGCGYALSATYELSEGTATSVRAVLGDPIFARGDGEFFAMNGQSGSVLITAGEEKLSSATAGRITALACRNGICATAEQTEEGTLVYVRDENAAARSAMNNFSEEVTRLTLSGTTVLVSGENGVFLTADCADPAAPKITAHKSVRGFVKGDYLLTGEQNEAGLRLSLYRVSGGAAEELFSYTKTLTAAEQKSLVLGGAGTAFIGDDRAGMAYSYFDGVSVVSEFVLFGKEQRVVTLYDDRTGITAAAEIDGRVSIFHGGICEPVE